jgi:transposase
VDRATLLTLSRDDLIALIEAQAGQIAALVKGHAQQIATLTARIIDLEAKLALPPKNPDNSSLPLSKGEKPNLPD